MPVIERDDHRSQSHVFASRRSLAIWIWSALFIADAVLVTRRLSGEFARPLPAVLALLSTALVAIAAWVAWRLYAGAQANAVRSRWPFWESRMLSAAVTAAWAWSISAGGTPRSAGLLLAVVAVLIWGLVTFDLIEATATKMSVPIPNAVNTANALPVNAKTDYCPATPLSVEADSPGILDEPDESLDVESMETETADIDSGSEDQLTLWLSRRDTDHGEQIEGWVRVPFASGQRETTVHVAFCPPMSVCPEIETEELDGADLEIRVAAVFPFGVRLSVRRSGPLDERNSDRIGFIAQSLSTQRAA